MITIKDTVVMTLSARERKLGKMEAEAREVWIFLLRYNICMNGLFFVMMALFLFRRVGKTALYDGGSFDLKTNFFG